MAKFIKFANANVELSVTGERIQNVYIHPEYVRVVSADPAGSSTLIQMDRQQFSVREDVDSVLKALS